MIRVYLILFTVFLFSIAKGQPAIGTSTFGSNVGAIAPAAPSPQTGTNEGWTFTLNSSANSAVTNGAGNINLISSPAPSGLWQSATITSSDGSAFSLTNFHFHSATAGFVGMTLTATGYQSGSAVPGATLTSGTISAVNTSLTMDASGINAFHNINEIRLVILPSLQRLRCPLPGMVL